MLYHFQLGIPKSIKTNFGLLKLSYSFHAQKAATNDRYGLIRLPSILNTESAKVIEVEVIDNKTVKVVYRIPYNNKFDLVLAVIPSDGFVKTVWLNDKLDNHKTLDESRYKKIG